MSNTQSVFAALSRALEMHFGSAFKCKSPFHEEMDQEKNDINKAIIQIRNFDIDVPSQNLFPVPGPDNIQQYELELRIELNKGIDSFTEILPEIVHLSHGDSFKCAVKINENKFDHKFLYEIPNSFNFEFFSEDEKLVSIIPLKLYDVPF